MICRLVLFKPLYTVKDAAELLGMVTRTLGKIILRGEIGTVSIDTGAKDPKVFITGWQLIDYIENLQGKPI